MVTHKYTGAMKMHDTCAVMDRDLLNHLLHTVVIDKAQKNKLIDLKKQVEILATDRRNPDLFIDELDRTIVSLDDRNRQCEAKALKEFTRSFSGNALAGCAMLTIGEVCEVINGGTPDTAATACWQGNIPWINSRSLGQFPVYLPARYISIEGIGHSGAKLLPKGATVLAVSGNGIRISLLGMDACTNQAVLGIIAGEAVPAEFVYLVLLTRLNDVAAGVKRGYLPKTYVSGMEIPVPAESYFDQYMPAFRNLFEEISQNVSSILTLRAIREPFGNLPPE